MRAAAQSSVCAHCEDSSRSTYSTAARRWEAVGPYYAMFPTEFADDVVLRYSEPGEVVLDPFAGRGTATFSAAIHGRRAIGVEISPVGWIYARTKLKPASHTEVLDRINSIARRSGRYADAASRLPPFFQAAFSKDVRRFLVAARTELDWRRQRADRTLMALLLVNLHGKAGSALSNQMRQTKAMSPEYALKWWAERELRPPELDPLDFMKQRIEWRYRHGVPEMADGRVYLGDSQEVLPRVARSLHDARRRPQLVFTSPPYFGVTNYHYDQWIRLWLLGGPPEPRSLGHRHRGKFQDLVAYRDMLLRVFSDARSLSRPGAVVYVRTYDRPLTLAATRNALTSAFPQHEYRRVVRPYAGRTQTQLFGQRTRYNEVDFVLRRAQ